MEDKIKYKSIDDWFNIENYERINSFCAAEWAVSLNYRFTTQISWEYRNFKSKDDYWRHYLLHSNPKNIDYLLKDEEYNWVCSNFDSVVEVPESAFECPEGPQVIGGNIRLPVNAQTAQFITTAVISSRQKVLLIDPEAPDTEIRREFEAWLAQLRNERPLPIKRRGPKATSVEVTEAHLKSWSDYRVLACFDLDFWAELFGKPRISHEKLCEMFMGPHFAGNAKEWGRSARRQVNVALDSFMVLGFQARRTAPRKPSTEGGTK